LHHGDHAASGGETPRFGLVGAQRGEIDRRDRRPETARGCQRSPPLTRARHARRVAYHRTVATEPALATVGVTVNGEAHRTPADSRVTDLIEELGLAGRRVAIAIGREVVPRSEHATRRLREGDRVEILEAVGGG
ncbi:MAG: sulfur carrier protein ThiS, partial [Myxococcota bacterium]